MSNPAFSTPAPNQDFYAMTIRDDASRAYVAFMIAEAMLERESALAEAEAEMARIGRPDIRYGFPDGYKAKLAEVGTHKACHRELSALADDMGIGQDVHRLLVNRRGVRG